MNTKILICILISLLSTSDILAQNENTKKEEMYYPSNTGEEWKSESLSSLGWNEKAMQPLKDFLKESNTKSFLILVNGKIVVEEYFDGHTASATWQWNSAGKTLVSTLTGIAQQENLLNINDKVSKYLSQGWTNELIEKENLITIQNLLSMTSGINDSHQLVRKRNLTYLADAGTRWAYSNIFQKQMDVVAKASGQDFETYFDKKIESKIGMNGYWKFGTIFSIYHSDTRSMARFGLLSLNNGKWKGEQIINETFFKEAISSSQSINPAYGYFWWLNGKQTYMTPAGQTIHKGALVSNAPADMYAAMGAGDQRIYIVPGKKMVVIRMGKSYDPKNRDFAISGFDNALWAKIIAVIN